MPRPQAPFRSPHALRMPIPCATYGHMHCASETTLLHVVSTGVLTFFGGLSRERNQDETYRFRLSRWLISDCPCRRQRWGRWRRRRCWRRRRGRRRRCNGGRSGKSLLGRGWGGHGRLVDERTRRRGRLCGGRRLVRRTTGVGGTAGTNSDTTSSSKKSKTLLPGGGNGGANSGNTSPRQ